MSGKASAIGKLSGVHQRQHNSVTHDVKVLIKHCRNEEWAVDIACQLGMLVNIVYTIIKMTRLWQTQLVHF